MTRFYYWNLQRNRDRNNYVTSPEVNPIPVLAIAGAILVGTVGISVYFMKQETKVKEQTRIECQEAEDKMFDEGEHIITMPIENPTSSVIEYKYREGYRPVGISTSSYGQSGYHFGNAFILYENTTPVIARPTNKDYNGQFVYGDFGTTLEKETKEIKEENGKIIYPAGTHIISAPFSTHGNNVSGQFESHDGYEVVGMGNSGYGKSSYHGNYGCILYVNNEEVVVDKNMSNGQPTFGTPTGKVLTK